MDEQIKNLYDLDMQDLGLTISSGGRTTCRSKSWGSKSEWSQVAKLYRPLRGRGWVEVGGKVTQLKAGQLYLIPPHVRMSYGTSSEIVIDWLHFQLQSLHLDGWLGSTLKVHLFNRSVTARMKPVCLLIERFMCDRSLTDAFRIHAMLLELAGLTLARLPEEDPQTRLTRERLMPALRLLDQEAVKHPSLRDVARVVHFSPEHFHRLFQSIFHTTPHQYAEARRMMLAKSLLSEGETTVTEVAARCGYADPFYFSRVFRRHFKASPGKVRQGLAVVAFKP